MERFDLQMNEQWNQKTTPAPGKERGLVQPKRKALRHLKKSKFGHHWGKYRPEFLS
jgi:hypothetical protein